MVYLSAGAGKKAHPRVSGENIRYAEHLVPSNGSSPRERGKLKRAFSFVSTIGLIPA